MRWFLRIGIICLCLFLWSGLFSVFAITDPQREEYSRKPFSFPSLLPGTEVYIWSLSESFDERQYGVTLLVVQNIGEYPIENVEIAFSADGKRLYFETEHVPPGQKVLIKEKDATLFDAWDIISCISYTAKKGTYTSFDYDEDYSCKK